MNKEMKIDAGNDEEKLIKKNYSCLFLIKWNFFSSAAAAAALNDDAKNYEIHRYRDINRVYVALIVHVNC